MNHSIFKKWILIAAACIITYTTVLPQFTEAVAAPALRYGSYSVDVPDLQFRLKVLGYFKSDVTTYYGKMTRDAVERFQADYGLVPDGVAGSKTWSLLKRVSVNQAELDLLARIIYAESRGEPYKGQVAVGAVVMNRLQSNLFPDTVKGVIMQSGAFTAVNDGQFYLQPDATAYKAALDAAAGWDPTGNAIYYFNPSTATSKWIWSRPQTVQIGRHIFAK
ncbi:spore cortex-lytic enzyme [Paenibacillus xylaniclasticus]|uniref:spore cortex-lytic enzyme n=1 Tax=Paenibacillus xylaniclasticus TaxID=588083 RepID=UPI000FDA45AE|nr:MULTISPECIES: spore cortex-lytic enzyme [Paenibacillus]GFN31772.1 spore cortex-lytic enzyme [Paenibacillus curdlanolyticus]